MSATVDGLVRRGELIVVGATPDMVEASGYQMIGGMKKIYGHASGTAIEPEQTLRVAAQSGVHPWIRRSCWSTPKRRSRRCCPARPDSAWCSQPATDGSTTRI
jgi:D-arabinose 1-dehydrogenase-like Zn-dependent alcohol dehydrogenase